MTLSASRTAANSLHRRYSHMKSIQDCYTLNNGMKLPCIGFGTYQTINGDGKAVILDAIRAGYRFFDAASLYETERVLGAAIKESGLPRSEFII